VVGGVRMDTWVMREKSMREPTESVDFGRKMKLEKSSGFYINLCALIVNSCFKKRKKRKLNFKSGKISCWFVILLCRKERLKRVDYSE